MNSVSDQIDASCQRPVKLFVAGAGFWLLIGAGMALLASIELHIPDFSSPIWNFGKLQAAQNSALLYGFGMQSIFAVSVWILCRVRNSPLTGAGFVTIASLFWNLAVVVGVTGIFLGDATGFDAFQMPGYTAPIFLTAFLVIAVAVWKAFLVPDAQLCGVSGYFVAAALVWFAWAYLNATVLIQLTPVRGVVQSCIAGWHGETLKMVIFGLSGLSVAFYFIPKVLGIPLHSRQLAFFALWTLSLFGAGANIPNGAPFPAWIISVSTVSTILLTLPLLAVIQNLHLTVRRNLKELDANPGLRFVGAGMICWVIVMSQTIVGAIPDVNRLTSFTLFTSARNELFFWGFFALTFLGAMHLMLPRLCGKEWPYSKLTGLQFWGVLLGIFLVYLANLVGGIGQALMLNDANIPFATVMKATLLPLRIGTVGYLLIFFATLAMAIHLSVMLLQKSSASNMSITPPRKASSNAHFYLGLALTLILPWIAFVAGPAVQLGGLQPEKVIGSETTLYPQSRPGLAIEGAQIYRANGCVACHTQQVRPADLGSDLARGWGRRRTVARDYIYDTPPQPGAQRVGPDLANIGLRQNADTLLLHLYNPQATVPKSIMPSYRFLFESKKAGREPSSDALKIAGHIQPGAKVVPTPKAKALAAYLQSLRADKPLYETPMPAASARPPSLEPKGHTNTP